MNHTLIFTFLLGGIMFSGVYYLSTIIKNPALAAVLSLIPLSILCGFSLPNKKTFSIYIQNVLVVATLSLIIMFISFIINKYTNINYIFVIIISLVLWTIIQYSKYLYFETYHPGFQKLT